MGILLDAGVPSDVLDKAKRTPLSYAGSANVFRMLILSGTAAAGGEGKNPLHCAALEGRTPLYFLNAMDVHPWLRGRCYKLLYIATVLVFSGAREWRHVQRPCRFLEATLPTV